MVRWEREEKSVRTSEAGAEAGVGMEPGAEAEAGVEASPPRSHAAETWAVA